MGIKDDFKNLEPSKAAMVGIILATIYYFLLFDKGDAITAEKATLQTTINQKTERLKQVENAMNNKAAFQKEVDELTRNFDDLIKYFPVDLDMNNMLYQVRKRLEATSNKMESIKKGEAKTRRFEGYNEATMEIESRGSFHDAMSFLSSLTSMDRVVDFIKMDLASDGSTDEISQVKLKLTLSIFSQSEKSKPPAGSGGKVGG